eukprot:82877_1
MSCPVIELTQQLIRRPSLSPDDAGCQALLIERLQAIGFTVERMDFADTQNFWAWRGQGETLAFAGHTDVVPPGDADRWINPPFEPTIRDGMLFGRGAADMKGSLAAMVVAAERFVAQHPNHTGRLAFLITSDEEASAHNGTVKVVEALMARNERLDYCLVGEPSSIEVATANGLTGMSAWLASTLFALVVGALADTIGFSPLFAVLAVFDLLGALVIWTVLQNKPAIEVAQETHNDPAPQH